MRGSHDNRVEFTSPGLVLPTVSKENRALMAMDEKALQSLAEAAKEQALKNFNREVMMDKYLSLFTELG